ncbi:MFS transporter [Actinomadura formosensis]|uniref:MFS transporter n=1 Tax=Actinomadura formosensis TaxID=60706 RepID=UPI003D8D3814
MRTGAAQRETTGIIVSLVAVGAAFLAMFDATVINLAIPALGEDYTSSSVAALTWTITIYAIIFAALLAPAGRAGDVLGCRVTYLGGIGLFTVASVVCAVSPNLPVLFAGRGLQAVGAAAMVPASLAILLRNSRPEHHAKAIGMWGAASAAAAAIGPSAGGLLVDSLHWRSLFWINLPIGLALIWCIRAIPRTGGAGGAWPDLPGTILLAAGIGAIVLGVGEGPAWHWTDPRTIGSIAAGGLMLTVALRRSVRHPVPAVETTLWRSHRYVLANLASFCYGAALFPWLLVGILYLTQVWHYDEFEAGLAQSPGAITAALSAMLAPRLIRKYGPQAAIIAGALIMAVVVLWIHFGLTVHPRFLAFWLPTGLLVGVGMGALANGVASAAAMSVHPRQFAGAVGLNTAARQVGGALGVAALAAIMSVSAPAVLGDYLNVYLFCGVSALAAAAAGVAIAARGSAGSSAGGSTTETVQG